MSHNEKVVLGALLIVAVIYFSTRPALANASQDSAGFVPGGADGGFSGVTGSWFTTQPLL